MVFRIITTSYQASQDAIRDVRRRVFVEEQGIPAELEWDEHDQNATFVIALNDTGNAIGTARLLADGRIGRMAVLPEWRNQGVGSAMLTTLLDNARQQALPAVYLSAQHSACGFYRRFDFVAEGAPYHEAGIPHQRMRLALPINDQGGPA